MDEAFRAGHAAVQAYIAQGRPRSTHSAELTTLHLITRSLSDVGWAQVAATDRFPVQAYSLMRPAWEAINLCDLFATKPELADNWAAGEFGKFTPRAVREELGIDSDAFYSFMCERSHPRFAGLQMTMFKLERDLTCAGESGNDQSAILHLNDAPLEATAVFMTAATPAIVLARLAPQAGRIQFQDDQRRPRHLAPMIREVAAVIRTGWHAMDDALRDDERDDPEARRPREWAENIGGALDTFASQVEAVYASGKSPPRGG